MILRLCNVVENCVYPRVKDLLNEFESLRRLGEYIDE